MWLTAHICCVDGHQPIGRLLALISGQSGLSSKSDRNFAQFTHICMAYMRMPLQAILEFAMMAAVEMFEMGAKDLFNWPLKLLLASFQLRQ